ncbi:MAG: SDR family NAD(P)-dependent oxidoreductase [Actinomycetota bacterium]
MQNALGQPQTILLLGGTSEIGRAIVGALASPQLRTVVLAQRDGTAGAAADPDPDPDPDLGAGADADPEAGAVAIGGLAADVDVRTVTFDATEHTGHRTWLDGLVAEVGDLDVVVQAFGQLGSVIADDPVAADPAAAAALVDANTTGAVSSGLAVAEVLRRQGHGTLIVLSSVAGVRTRASNFVYGASKAGQDAFSTGLAAHLAGTGVHVMTVRPGFVRSRMTAGMDEAPFACDPADVGAAVAEGVRRRRRIVWVPGILRWVLGTLRLAPEFVWRRLDR